MSSKNTHTPTLSDVNGKARYKVPTHKVHGADAYYLTPELEAHFRRLYPATFNLDIMRLFGISFSTVQRFKRQLGLQKNMRVIARKQAKVTKRICEANGYYASIRGKQPSEACMEAARRKRASGFSPILELKKKNPRKYRQMLAKKSEARKELMRKERLRVEYGLGRKTALWIPFYPMGRKRITFRYCCKQAGYIPGNARDDKERWIIYYDEQTKRGQIREQRGKKLGFVFRPIKNNQNN